jgi:hypothetical protein
MTMTMDVDEDCEPLARGAERKGTPGMTLPHKVDRRQQIEGREAGQNGSRRQAK